MADWLETHRGVVHPWHCDQFGHMNVRWYAHFFDDAGFHLWTAVGVPLREQQERRVHTVVARTAIDYLHESRIGDLLVVKSGIVKVGSRSCTHLQKMVNADTGVLHARQETVEVFFDAEARKSAPMPDDIRARLEAHIIDPES